MVLSLLKILVCKSAALTVYFYLCWSLNRSNFPDVYCSFEKYFIREEHSKGAQKCTYTVALHKF